MSDLVSRLRVEVGVGDSPAKLDQVRAGVVGIGQAGAQASGGVGAAAAAERELQAAAAGASTTVAALQAEVTQLIQAMVGVRGGMQAATAATVTNAEASAAASAAITGQALATRELGAVQAATTSGLGAQTSASKALGAATGAVGEAMGGARVAGGGLLALVGGPLSLGVAAGALAMDLFGRAIDAVKDANERVKQSLATSVDILGELKKEAEETADYTVKLSLAMGDSATQADLTSGAYDRQAVAAAGAARAIRDMTLAQQVQDLDKSQKQLKDLQAAQRTTGLLGLVTTDNTERGVRSRERLLSAAYGNETQRRFTKRTDAELMAELGANSGSLSPELQKKLAAANRDSAAYLTVDTSEKVLKTRIDALNASINAIMNGGQPETSTLVDEITVTADRNKKPKANTAGLRAGISAKDAAADVAAENARTAAIIAGGKALDDWQVKEAGRQAVEKTALADKPKLTAAQTALIAQIRTSAEETERLKIANERLVKGADLTRSAEADTAALKSRAEAAAQGVAAMEALSVKEAGLDALHKIGVDSLDQLTGKTLDQAKAAMTAAEAAQAQSIATAKAERVADQVRDLDKRIASEKAYAAALANGVEGIVAYQRAEFVRQEVEKAGENLTKEQVATLTAKAQALFAVQAAANSADLTRRQADELHLAQLTNQERQVEQRFLERKSLLLAEHADWTREEVDARARALALADQAAAEDAQAIGQLRENLEDAFVKGGKLGMDDIADYAEQALRRAIYKAWLEKPFEILVNAVVSGASSIGGGVGQAGGGTPGQGALSYAMSSIMPIAMAAAVAYSFDRKVSGSLVSGLGGDERQVANAQKYGGLFGLVGGAVAALVGGKKSNSAAVLGLDATGNVISTGGDKRTAETTGAATSAAAGIAALEQALIAAGATLKTTVTSIDLGVRDQTHIGLSNGQALQSAVGDAGAAIEAAGRAIIEGATFATEAQTAYARSALAAGASLDDVVAAMQAAAALPKSIDDAILQITDPARFEREQALAAIDASYNALKTKANEMIAAGLVSADVLAKIDQLKDLQVADTLKQLGDAAAEAAAQIAEQAAQVAAQHAADLKSAADLSTSVDLAILKITNPDEYARQSALYGVTSNYDNLKAQAQVLIEAGVLSADILTKLDQMRDLQITDALAALDDQVQTTAEIFASARPKLLDWLDSLSTSANSPLNAYEQRQAAMASYERQLELARGGNADALSGITGYADQLLSADREATQSAADRLALYAKVQADVAALAAQTAASNAAPMQVVLASTDLSAFTASIEISGDKLSARLDAIAAKVEQLAKTSDQGSAKLVGEVVSGLREIGAAVAAGMDETAQAIDHLATAQDLATATLRRIVN